MTQYSLMILIFSNEFSTFLSNERSRSFLIASMLYQYENFLNKCYIAYTLICTYVLYFREVENERTGKYRVLSDGEEEVIKEIEKGQVLNLE